MSTYPSWAIDLVAALEEHEDIHPAAGTADGDEHWCVKKILDAVPPDVRSYVATWKDGFETGKSWRASGGVIERPKLSPAGEIFLRAKDAL